MSDLPLRRVVCGGRTDALRLPISHSGFGADVLWLHSDLTAVIFVLSPAIAMATSDRVLGPKQQSFSRLGRVL